MDKPVFVIVEDDPNLRKTLPEAAGLRSKAKLGRGANLPSRYW